MAAKDRWLQIAKWALLLTLLVALLPMARVAFYNHSSVDDFYNGALTHTAWQETHDIWLVLEKALEHAKTIYLTWQGSYAALPLFALQPAIFGEAWYCVSFFILMGSWLLAVFSSLRRLWQAYLPHSDRTPARILAALYCLMTIELMPFPVEAFYWWNGSVYYFFFQSLAVVLLANVLLLTQRAQSGRRSAGLLAGSLLLAALVAGSNYVTVLTLLEIMALLVLIQMLRRHPARFQMLAVLLVTLAGFGANALAPGNTVRQEVTPKSSFLWAILHSFEEAWNHALEWTGLPLLLFLLVLAAFLWLVPTDRLFARRWTLPVLTVLSLLIYVSSFTPAMYAISWKGPGRARNLCFLFWTVSCCLGLLTLEDGLRLLLRRHGGNSLLRAVAGFHCPRALLCTALCFLLIAGDACVRFKAGDRTRYASLSALHALLSGEAESYDAVIRDRGEILAGDDPNPVLPDFRQDVPLILYFDDLTYDPGDWRNVNMAAYYHKQTVVKARPQPD